MTLLIVLALLLASLLAYVVVITSDVTEPEPELLVDPQYCRNCRVRCRSTLCLNCQLDEAEGLGRKA